MPQGIHPEADMSEKHLKKVVFHERNVIGVKFDLVFQGEQALALPGLISRRFQDVLQITTGSADGFQAIGIDQDFDRRRGQEGGQTGPDADVLDAQV